MGAKVINIILASPGPKSVGRHRILRAGRAEAVVRPEVDVFRKMAESNIRELLNLIKFKETNKPLT